MSSSRPEVDAGAGVPEGTPSLEGILARIDSGGDAAAVFSDGRDITYSALASRVEDARATLRRDGVERGSVVALFGDYGPDACALILALLAEGAILVPFMPAAETQMAGLMLVAGCQFLVTSEDWRVERIPDSPQNELIEEFRRRRHPGLVVFTSGSTGPPKGVLHDAELLLRKFVDPRPGWRTVLFLSIDHLGGLNTLFSCFAYGGTAICLPSRSPEAVASTIAASRATLLPTTPTFLNLLAASGVYRYFDLSSIRLITYGTEAMPEATLAKVHAMFPSAEVKQTYGLSELGVLRSKSLSSDSTWVKIGGLGFEVKIVDQMLHIRSESNMVGYLNAPDPFDADGWLNTGDEVEVRGEYVRILGRRSEMINVGGQKVSPLEVESVLLEAPNVVEAAVWGERHSLMGQVVRARVALDAPEDEQEAVVRLRRFCVERLPRFKIPVRFEIASVEDLRGARYKKVRGTETGSTV